MTLRTDERARVPFALVGVVLLVSTAVYTGALTATEPVSDRTPTERALSRAQTATHLTVERATVRASVTAAARPLTAPADTPVGRVLAEGDPFERYLRLLVYRRARLALDDVSAAAGDTSVDPSLPAIDGPADVRRAIERTTIEPVDDGRRLRVTIAPIPYAIERDGEPVATHRSRVSVVVATPVLDLHRRTSTYERRLDADPTAGPGLGRRVTARLWATTQTRGLAQYGGAPIANVLPTRHVELQTNAAAVALQRESFGRSDPESAGALRWATARVGVHDGVAAASVGRDRWSERVLRRPDVATPAAARAAIDPPARPPPRTVNANQTADRALVSVLDGDTSALDTALARAYTIDARLLATQRVVSTRTTSAGDRPPTGLLARTTRKRSLEVRPATDAPVHAPAGFTIAGTSAHRVVETERVVWTWRTTSGTRRVETTTTTVHRVDLAVATRYSPAPAPERTVSASAGQRRLRDAAVDRLLGASAARERLARNAVDDAVDTRVRRISVDPPTHARQSARRAVLDTHRRARTVTATVNRSGAVRPGAGALADAIEANRTRLIDAPRRYDGPAAVARTNARQAYLDAVTTKLAADRSTTSGMTDALESALRARELAIPGVHDTTTPARARTGVTLSTTPTYLPVTEVTPAMAAVDESYHPLATRNVNLFTVPSSDVADAVSEAAVGPGTGEDVDLAVAARTLDASGHPAVSANESLTGDRRSLTAAVEDATATVAASQTRVLARQTPLSTSDSRAIVARTLGAYPTPAARALAATNGTLSARLAAAASRRVDVDEAVLAARLRVAATEARRDPGARVADEPVTTVGSTTRDVAREAVRRAAARASERAAERAKGRVLARSMAALPAGLPVAPVPGSWYATVNVWVVDVRGAYHRVEVRSTVASPALGPDGLTYVREDAAVHLDVDGDDTPERLGRVDPVAFRVQTVLLVAVPPGPRGVGDTDGNADERSPGWPGPDAAQPPAQNGTQTTPPSIGSP